MAKDIYHEIVREALIQDGWLITHDPYSLKDWDPDWEIDLGAERLFTAERGTEKIAVEVKSFLVDSFAYEFHRALGQFMNYQASLEVVEPERILFLAIPIAVYETEFHRKGIKLSIERYAIRVLIFNPLTKLIIQWAA